MNHSKKDNESLYEPPFGIENIKKRIRQLSLIQNREIKFNIFEAHTEGEKWTMVAVGIPMA